LRVPTVSKKNGECWVEIKTFLSLNFSVLDLKGNMKGSFVKHQISCAFKNGKYILGKWTFVVRFYKKSDLINFQLN